MAPLCGLLGRGSGPLATKPARGRKNCNFCTRRSGNWSFCYLRAQRSTVLRTRLLWVKLEPWVLLGRERSQRLPRPRIMQLANGFSLRPIDLLW